MSEAKKMYKKLRYWKKKEREATPKNGPRYLKIMERIRYYSNWQKERRKAKLIRLKQIMMDSGLHDENEPGGGASHPYS